MKGALSSLINEPQARAPITIVAIDACPRHPPVLLQA